MAFTKTKTDEEEYAAWVAAEERDWVKKQQYAAFGTEEEERARYRDSDSDSDSDSESESESDSDSGFESSDDEEIECVEITIEGIVYLKDIDDVVYSNYDEYSVIGVMKDGELVRN